MDPDGDGVIAVRAFLDGASSVAPELATPSSVAQFEEFPARASASAADPLRETTSTVVPHVMLMLAWATEHDPLAAALERRGGLP